MHNTSSALLLLLSNAIINMSFPEEDHHRKETFSCHNVTCKLLFHIGSLYDKGFYCLKPKVTLHSIVNSLMHMEISSTTFYQLTMQRIDGCTSLYMDDVKQDHFVKWSAIHQTGKMPTLFLSSSFWSRTVQVQCHTKTKQEGRKECKYYFKCFIINSIDI